jgi:5-methylcytosine-specific restriction endonuclease McrA
VAHLKEYYLQNRERLLARMREYSRVKAEEQRQYRAERAALRREATKKWRIENPDLAQAQWSRRRASEANPAWADQRAIAAIYAARPPGMVVDHIVPLKGKTVEGYLVSGLHVPWNLQYLSDAENARKLNRMRAEDQSLVSDHIGNTP